MKTFLLILSLLGHSGGVSFLEFDTLEKCNDARIVILDEMVPDWNKEKTWTTNALHISAGKRTKCVAIDK
jgi:hypothetical protein